MKNKKIQIEDAKKDNIIFLDDGKFLATSDFFFQDGNFECVAVGNRHGWSFFDIKAKRKYENHRQRLTKKKREEEGHIYVVQIENFNYYKIGWSLHLFERLSKAQTFLPFEIKPIFGVKVKNVRKKEAQLHKLFKEKRIRGEWFQLSFEDLALIKHKLQEGNHE